ncbi:hypothetical protein SARC_07746 [Sphaeroforma arctica JP610]|uniref:Uncharacterized protein n=1 Tax=Sphaeroforma arctica JP610 TaxID=667725 RepID=A0A0L0FSU0_9EUKA|nr:hypothetical protein SARC_07746 [Sphaeroforma arctica JP610]KNC79877.1 hypothetical protein SARC_07746 [Sphaeroforma arctica JP610]|eukprot:XP_014153779.1 hypothetical protein SARC_07746 [Sphaeroforma arctica JP610]
MEDPTAENMVRSASIVLDELFNMCVNTKARENLYTYEAKPPNNYTLSRMLDSLSRDVSDSSARARACISKRVCAQYGEGYLSTNDKCKYSKDCVYEEDSVETDNDGVLTRVDSSEPQQSIYITKECTSEVGRASKAILQVKGQAQLVHTALYLEQRDGAAAVLSDKRIPDSARTRFVDTSLNGQDVHGRPEGAREHITTEDTSNATIRTDSSTSHTMSRTTAADDARRDTSDDEGGRRAPNRPQTLTHGDQDNTLGTHGGKDNRGTTSVTHGNKNSKNSQPTGGKGCTDSDKHTVSTKHPERTKRVPTRPARRSGGAESDLRHRRNLAYFMDDPLNPYTAWPLPPKREHPNMDTGTAVDSTQASPRRGRQTPTKAKPNWRSVGRNVDYSQVTDNEKAGNKHAAKSRSLGHKQSSGGCASGKVAARRTNSKEPQVQPKDRKAIGMLGTDTEDAAGSVCIRKGVSSGRTDKKDTVSKPKPKPQNSITRTRTQSEGKSKQKSAQRGTAKETQPKKRTRLSDQTKRKRISLNRKGTGSAARASDATDEATNIAPMPKIGTKKAPTTGQNGRRPRDGINSGAE